jgi:hypothetical protein
MAMLPHLTFAKGQAWAQLSQFKYSLKILRHEPIVNRFMPHKPANDWFIRPEQCLNHELRRSLPPSGSHCGKRLKYRGLFDIKPSKML